jgi:hypothetical protein
VLNTANSAPGQRARAPRSALGRAGIDQVVEGTHWGLGAFGIRVMPAFGWVRWVYSAVGR